MELKPHQQRVVDEKRELDDKLTKLDTFGCTELFKSLPADEQGRLCRQHSLMEQYSAVLGERIAAFPPSAGAEKPGPDERHLRRLLAKYVAMPMTYFDDGEASGLEKGISIDFLREPVADIDAKLHALGVARLECSKTPSATGEGL